MGLIEYLLESLIESTESCDFACKNGDLTRKKWYKVIYSGNKIDLSSQYCGLSNQIW